MSLDAIRAMRTGLEGVVALLLELLDTIDGDENLEDTDEDSAVDDNGIDEGDSGDNEPSLARTESIHQGSGSYANGWIIDGELSADDVGEPEDRI